MRMRNPVATDRDGTALALLMVMWTLTLAMRPVRADAQTAAKPATEVSIGYAFRDVEPLAHQFASTTEQGWDASVTQRITRWMAITGQVTGTYGASIGTGLAVGPPALKGTMHPSTYVVMAGPRDSWPGHGFEPFVQGLVGFARARAGLNGVDFVSVQTDTGFATGLGAGLDVAWTPRVSVRLVDIEWDRLSVFEQTQRRLGVSVGLIVGFGRH
jgi:hypothetical protein